MVDRLRQVLPQRPRDKMPTWKTKMADSLRLATVFLLLRGAHTDELFADENLLTARWKKRADLIICMCRDRLSEGGPLDLLQSALEKQLDEMTHKGKGANNPFPEALRRDSVPDEFLAPTLGGGILHVAHQVTFAQASNHQPDGGDDATPPASVESNLANRQHECVGLLQLVTLEVLLARFFPAGDQGTPQRRNQETPTLELDSIYQRPLLMTEPEPAVVADEGLPDPLSTELRLRHPLGMLMLKRLLNVTKAEQAWAFAERCGDVRSRCAAVLGSSKT